MEVEKCIEEEGGFLGKRLGGGSCRKTGEGERSSCGRELEDLGKEKKVQSGIMVGGKLSVQKIFIAPKKQNFHNQSPGGKGSKDHRHQRLEKKRWLNYPRQKDGFGKAS